MHFHQALSSSELELCHLGVMVTAGGRGPVAVAHNSRGSPDAHPATAGLNRDLARGSLHSPSSHGYARGAAMSGLRRLFSSNPFGRRRSSKHDLREGSSRRGARSDASLRSVSTWARGSTANALAALRWRPSAWHGEGAVLYPAGGARRSRRHIARCASRGSRPRRPAG